MSKHGFREWLEKIFPSDDGRQSTNELVERGLDALRLARNERAFSMGDVIRVPSRLELRLSPERYEELKGMDAARDLEFFFNDELMKDLAVEGLRTFGDHAVHVTVAADTALGPDELYAIVLAPESGSVERGSFGGVSAPPDRSNDSTRMLGDEPSPATVAVGAPPPPGPSLVWRLVVVGPGGYSIEERLEGRHWIIGRRGSSGRPLPERYRKVDLDVRETISREQVRIELLDDRMTIECVGKAPVLLPKNETLAPGESRTLPIGTPFAIEDYEVRISR